MRKSAFWTEATLGSRAGESWWTRGLRWAGRPVELGSLRQASIARSQFAHTQARRSSHQPFRTTSKGDAMFGRMTGLIGGLVALLFLGIVAAVAFAAGQASVPVGAAGDVGTAVPVYVGHYGWGFGFGFLGFLFPLFFFLLLFWLLRPRWGGRGDFRHRAGPRGRGQGGGD